MQMKTFVNSSQRPDTETVVAIGSFDGVHLGHQALLAQLKAKARLHRVPSVVYTFDPPTRVLMQGVAFLSTLPEKLELLARYGVDETVAVSFTPEFAAQPKELFLDDLRRLRPKSIVVGEDFYFGKSRTGSSDDLKALCEVMTLPMHQLAGTDIKSTRVRQLLTTGDVQEAARLLGRPYSASGVVVQGQKLGRTLGYPTANICVSEGKALPQGVFAVRVHSSRQTYSGMANIGVRPTVNSNPQLDIPQRHFEVHLFDMNDDLYGQELSIEFVAKLRDELKFANLDALKAQLSKDAAKANELLD